MEPKFRYRIHSSLLLICILSHIIVAQTVINYFFTIQPSSFPSNSLSLGFQTKMTYAFLLSSKPDKC
jgi:hypothetical protein